MIKKKRDVILFLMGFLFFLSEVQAIGMGFERGYGIGIGRRYNIGRYGRYDEFRRSGLGFGGDSGLGWDSERPYYRYGWWRPGWRKKWWWNQYADYYTHPRYTYPYNITYKYPMYVYGNRDITKVNSDIRGIQKDISYLNDQLNILNINPEGVSQEQFDKLRGEINRLKRLQAQLKSR